MKSVVIMGVAGCGKSSLAAEVAAAEGLPLVEGDEHHSASNRLKMQRGIPLDDGDRSGWLASLGRALGDRPGGVVLTCSALKRKYRDQLREALPGLRFVFMEISRDAAQARVSARAEHFFSPRLVDSQFEALEPPVGEPQVLRVDALRDLALLREEVSTWLRESEPG